MKENSLSVKEREQLVLNNMGLVYFVASKYKSFNSPDYEDFCSIATIGLIKASITYSDCNDTSFATYSTVCMHNEILMYLRKTDKHNVCISLYSPVFSSGAFYNCAEKLYIDEIPNPKNCIDNFIEEIEIQEEALLSLQNYTNIIFNYLDKQSRIIITYRINLTTQFQIANLLGLSQSYISRLEKEIHRKINLHLNSRLKLIDTYTLFKKNNLYGISFFINDIENFNALIKTALKNISLITKLPDKLKITRCSNKVTIYFLYLECDFYFVYLILNEICDKGIIIKN